MNSPFPGMDPFLEGHLWPDVHLGLSFLIKELITPQVGSDYVVRNATYTVASPIEVHVPVVEILDRKNNRLITAIEILSPVNKRHPGLEPYRKKRLRLHEAGVHLLEIDLLRRGERPFKHPYLPKSPYMALLTRAGSTQTQVWAFHLNDPLPVLPVPLKAPDPDIPLALRKALDEVYTRSRYHLSIDYRSTPPPPPLKTDEERWMRQLLETRQPAG